MRPRHALTIGFAIGALAVTAYFGVALLRPSLPATTRVGSIAAVESSPSPVVTPPTSGPCKCPPPPTASPSTAGVAGPEPREGAVMVFDPEDSGLIMFGGADQNATLGDTWLWNGKWWTRLDVTGPPARSVASAAYDSVRHVIVLFGGSGPAGTGNAKLFQDTWTWDGARWQLLTPAHSPDPRARAAMAFDKNRGQVVMFGGENQTSVYTSTWTWDGIDWTLHDTRVSPSARDFTSMAYDEALGETLLFGGSGIYGQRLNDTWTWDGTNWAQRVVPAPTASGWSTLVYDDATKQVVAYVYYALDNHPVREYTTTYDGSGWSDRSTASDPSPRAGVAMAYDPRFDQVVMFGGSYIGPPYGETWTWMHGAWSQAPASA